MSQPHTTFAAPFSGEDPQNSVASSPDLAPTLYEQQTILQSENVVIRDKVEPENALDYQYKPQSLSDKFAKAACDLFGRWADLFFQKRFGHRAVVLETVAAVPGTVAAFHHQLESYRTVNPSKPLIRVFQDEAENERMHLRIFSEIAQPTKFEHFVIRWTQMGFTALFSAAYFFFPHMAHRFVGHIEEKAVDSYTRYLAEIDAGNIENVPAPQIAIDYYRLPPEARLRDVVIAVRRDEMEHRDVNHRVAHEFKVK